MERKAGGSGAGTAGQAGGAGDRKGGADGSKQAANDDDDGDWGTGKKTKGKKAGKVSQALIAITLLGRSLIASLSARRPRGSRLARRARVRWQEACWLACCSWHVAAGRERQVRDALPL